MLERLFSDVHPQVAEILDAALSGRELTTDDAVALPMALTTLPNQLGWRSPKKLVKRPSSAFDIRTRISFGLAADFSGLTGSPASSMAWKYRPSRWK